MSDKNIDNNPRVIVIQKLYGKHINKDSEIKIQFKPALVYSTLIERKKQHNYGVRFAQHSIGNKL